MRAGQRAKQARQETLPLQTRAVAAVIAMGAIWTWCKTRRDLPEARTTTIPRRPPCSRLVTTVRAHTMVATPSDAASRRFKSRVGSLVLAWTPFLSATSAPSRSRGSVSTWRPSAPSATRLAIRPPKCCCQTKSFAEEPGTAASATPSTDHNLSPELPRACASLPCSTPTLLNTATGLTPGSANVTAAS